MSTLSDIFLRFHKFRSPLRERRRLGVLRDWCMAALLYACLAIAFIGYTLHMAIVSLHTPAAAREGIPGISAVLEKEELARIEAHIEARREEFQALAERPLSRGDPSLR